MQESIKQLNYKNTSFGVNKRINIWLSIDSINFKSGPTIYTLPDFDTQGP